MQPDLPSVSVLVVGHGTRNPKGASQLRELVSQIRSLLPSRRIEGCFLELARPTIDEAVASLHADGIHTILIVPILLFSAGHAKEDIPNAVGAIARRLGMAVVGQTPALGTNPDVIGLSATRFREVVRAIEGYPCNDGYCALVGCQPNRCQGTIPRPGRIGLAMVGRGTSDQAALDQMRTLTAQRVLATPVVWHQTGFFAGGSPKVDDLLDQAADSTCETIVVQPHLLFEGELMDQLRARILDRQSRDPDRGWFLARCLGADPMLAHVFVSLIEHTLTSNHEQR